MPRTRALASAITLMIFLAGCGPTAEQIATMTAAAWTPTPVPSPTPTPIPYGLTAHIADESGAPLAGASIVVPESGSDEPAVTDSSGTYTWPNLEGPTISLAVSAPGYFTAVQAATLERGPSDIALILQRDPFGVLTADACAPEENLLYIEDFQDGKAQGWANLTAAVEFNAQSGWTVESIEEGNQAAVFSGILEGGDQLEGGTFDNAVWRLRVRTTGTEGFSFLNFRHASKPGGETRYPVQWGAMPQLTLSRLDFPDVGHFDVGRSTFRMKQDQWYYLEISFFQGTMQVWVDGQKVIEYTDPQPLPAGTISLEGHMFQEPPASIFVFDDFAVCGLNAPFATTMYKQPQ